MPGRRHGPPILFKARDAQSDRYCSLKNPIRSAQKRQINGTMNTDTTKNQISRGNPSFQ